MATYNPLIVSTTLTNVPFGSGLIAQFNLASHGLAVGAQVIVSGAQTIATAANSLAYNGTFNIQSTPNFAFTYITTAIATATVQGMVAKYVPSGTLSAVGSFATFTSVYPHGFYNGCLVTIYGATPTAFNGNFIISIVNQYTFTYNTLTSPSPSTATVQGIATVGPISVSQADGFIGTYTSSTVTISGSSYHGLYNGALISMTGSTPTSANINTNITVVNNNVFTYPVSAAGSGSLSGTWVAMGGTQLVSVTSTTTTATATTPIAHGLYVGAPIRISGSSVANQNTTTTVVTVPNNTQFTYTITSAAGTSNAVLSLNMPSTSVAYTAGSGVGNTQVLPIATFNMVSTNGSLIGFTVGETAFISGVTATTYNGFQRLTGVTSSPFFTYVMSSVPGAAATLQGVAEVSTTDSFSYTPWNQSNDTLNITNGAILNQGTLNQNHFWYSIGGTEGTFNIINSTTTPLRFLMGCDTNVTTSRITFNTSLFTFNVSGGWINIGTGTGSPQTLTHPFPQVNTQSQNGNFTINSRFGAGLAGGYDYMPSVWIEAYPGAGTGNLIPWHNCTAIFGLSPRYFRSDLDYLNVDPVRGNYFRQPAAYDETTVPISVDYVAGSIMNSSHYTNTLYFGEAGNSIPAGCNVYVQNIILTSGYLTNIWNSGGSIPSNAIGSAGVCTINTAIIDIWSWAGFSPYLFSLNNVSTSFGLNLGTCYSTSITNCDFLSGRRMIYFDTSAVPYVWRSIDNFAQTVTIASAPGAYIDNVWSSYQLNISNSPNATLNNITVTNQGQIYSNASGLILNNSSNINATNLNFYGCNLNLQAITTCVFDTITFSAGNFNEVIGIQFVSMAGLAANSTFRAGYFPATINPASYPISGTRFSTNVPVYFKTRSYQNYYDITSPWYIDSIVYSATPYVGRINQQLPGIMSYSLVGNGTIVTATTSNSHNLINGQVIIVANATNVSFNGVTSGITVTSPTTFTYPRTFTGTATVQGNIIPCASGSSITYNGTTCNFTSVTPHGFSTGNTVSVNGSSPDIYNGSFLITVSGSNAFSYNVPISPSGNATIPGYAVLCDYIPYYFGVAPYNNNGFWVVALKWSPSSTYYPQSATSPFYEIYRSTVWGNRGTLYAISSTNTTSTYTDNIISNNTTYYYTLLSYVNPYLCTYTSQQIAIIPNFSPTFPNYPSGVNGSGLTNLALQSNTLATSPWANYSGVGAIAPTSIANATGVYGPGSAWSTASTSKLVFAGSSPSGRQQTTTTTASSSITALSALVTTTVNHNLLVGSTVTFGGSYAPAQYVGNFVISETSATMPSLSGNQFIMTITAYPATAATTIGTIQATATSIQLLSSGTTCTFYTNLGYQPYAVGAQVTITAAVPTSYNGTFTVTNSTTSSFSYTALSAPGIAATTQGTANLAAALTASSVAGNVATFNGAEPHGFATGMVVPVTLASPTAYNVTSPIWVTTSSAFLYPLTGYPGGAASTQGSVPVIIANNWYNVRFDGWIDTPTTSSLSANPTVTLFASSGTTNISGNTGTLTRRSTTSSLDIYANANSLTFGLYSNSSTYTTANLAVYGRMSVTLQGASGQGPQPHIISTTATLASQGISELASSAINPLIVALSKNNIYNVDFGFNASLPTVMLEIFADTTPSLVPSKSNMVATTALNAIKIAPSLYINGTMSDIIVRNVSSYGIYGVCGNGSTSGWTSFMAFETGNQNNITLYNWNMSAGFITDAYLLSNPPGTTYTTNIILSDFNITNSHGFTSVLLENPLLCNGTTLSNINFDYADHALQLTGTLQSGLVIKNTSGISSGYQEYTVNNGIYGQANEGIIIPVGSYDSIFFECKDQGNETGKMGINFAPSALATPPYTINGSEVVFDNAGNLYFGQAGESITYQWPWRIYGISGFLPIAYPPGAVSYGTFNGGYYTNGTDIGNNIATGFGFLVQFSLSNDGISWTPYKSMTGANLSGASVSSETGFFMRVSIASQNFIKFTTLITPNIFNVGDILINSNLVTTPSASAQIVAIEYDPTTVATGTLVVANISGSWGYNSNIYSSTGVLRATMNGNSTFGAIYPIYATTKLTGIYWRTALDPTSEYPVMYSVITNNNLIPNTFVSVYNATTTDWLESNTNSTSTVLVSCPWNNIFNAKVKYRAPGYQFQDTILSNLGRFGATVNGAQVAWTRISSANPGSPNITFTDSGLSPILWNGYLFRYTIQVLDGSSAATVAQWFYWNTASNGLFGGSSYIGSAIPPLIIQDSGVAYTTQIGSVDGVSISGGGCRVVDISGNAITGFTSMQSNNGTYWTPPVYTGITFNGLVVGSQVVIYQSGTTSLGAIEIARINSSGTSYTYSTTYVSDQTIDYTILQPGYIPIQVVGSTLSSSIISAPISQIVDRVYSASSGLTWNSTVTVNTSSNQVNISTPSTLVNLYSFLIESWENQSALRNISFPFITNGPVSITFSQNWELTSDSDVIYLSQSGLRYISTLGATKAVWSALQSEGSVYGAIPRYQQANGSLTSSCNTSGSVDQLIKVYGDSTHGNFDYRSWLVVKSEPDSYLDASYDVVQGNGISTLVDTLYVVPLANTATGISAINPGITGVTIIDRGASPITWPTSSGLQYSITIQDSINPSTGTQLFQWISYAKSIGGTFQGKDVFNWHQLVEPAGAAFQTVNGIIYGGVGAALKGVNVVESDGITPHPAFTLFTSDSGATYSPPTILTAQVAGISAGSRLYVYNETQATIIVNSIISGSTWSLSYINGTSFNVGDLVQIRLSYQNGINAMLPFSTNVIASNGGWGSIASQVVDPIYNANGIDGSTCDSSNGGEFTSNYPNVEIDIDDLSGETSVQRIYAWMVYIQTTYFGIANFFNGMTAVDSVNYSINPSIVNLLLDNTGSVPVQVIGGYLYRTDGTTILAIIPGRQGIYMDPGKAYAIATGSAVLPSDIVSIANATRAAMEQPGSKLSVTTQLSSLIPAAL